MMDLSLSLSFPLSHWLNKQPFCNMCCNARSSITQEIFLDILGPPEKYQWPIKSWTSGSRCDLDRCVLVLPDFIGPVDAGMYLPKHQMLAIIIDRQEIHQEDHQGRPTNPSGSSVP